MAGGVPGGVAGGSMGGVIGGVIGGMGGAPPPPKPTASRIRQGGSVQAALLVNKVQPVYPPLARQTRISGTVRLHAIISKRARSNRSKCISGPSVAGSRSDGRRAAVEVQANTAQR